VFKLNALPLFAPFRQLWSFVKQSSQRSFSLLFTVPSELRFALIGLSVSLIVSACSSNAPTATNSSSPGASPVASGVVVRIGYQKAATILSLGFVS
jgi:hypothetical protein